MIENKTGFSIIVPAYNEAQGISETVSEIRKAFTRLGHEFEIIIVNDGSTDETGRTVDILAAKLTEVRVVHLETNYGKGYAIRKGVEKAENSYVVFMDADLDIHPQQIDRIIDKLKNRECDIAIGSKRHPESELQYPRSRRVISMVYSWIIFLLFGLNIQDTQAGLKIYKKDVLMSILPRLLIKKFAFDLEMLVAAKNLGCEIMEFPIKVNFSRKYGRITLRDCWRTGIDTLAIFYRHRILDFYSFSAPVSEYKPKVSIIIPLTIPDENLEQAISDCLTQDYDNFEIIIMPDTDSSEWLSSYKGHPRISIVPTGPVGPSIKRNMGAGKASGEILAFIDDDVFPFHDWLSTGIRHFADQSMGAVGGPAITPVESPFKERISGYILASPVVSGNFRYRYVPHRYQEVDDFPSCNLLVSRDVFETIGGFSSQHWPGEDTLLCRDIRMKAKKKIIYDPHVLVAHKRRPVFAAHLSQVSRYAMHRGYFLKHWPENSLKPGYFVPSLLILFLMLGIAFLGIPFFRWCYLSIAGLYLLICFIFSIRILGVYATLLSFTGTIATHLTYGLFFLKGLFSMNLLEHKPMPETGIAKTPLVEEEKA